jgi:hypothetical protein
MKPKRDITGGTVLRIPAIQSPNFAANSAGWKIAQDGSAQFNNVTLIGSIVITSSKTILVYSSAAPATGTLVMSIAPVAGSDLYGNNYPAGLAFYDGSENQIATLDPVNGLILNQHGGAQTVSLTDVPIYIESASGTQPATAANLTDIAGLIFTGIPALRIMGPTMDSGTDSKTSRVSIVMTGGNTADAAEGLLMFESTDSGGVVAILTWTKTSVTVAQPLIASSTLQVTGKTTLNEKATINSSDIAGALAIVQSVTTTSGPGTISHQESASTNGAYGLFVAGEAHTRFNIRADGQLKWGSGSASPDAFLERTAAGVLSATTNTSIAVGSAGQGYQVKEGTNAKMGTATLVAGTVTVSTTAVTANSRIFLTAQSTGGTPGALRVSARSAGTSFTITSTSSTDTSLVAWFIVEPA